MNRWSSAWRPMLLGMVLMAILVGAAGAVPTEKTLALSAPRQLIIAASDFYPVDETISYSNTGGQLMSQADATTQVFLAPADFPVAYYATIDKLELFGFDNNGAAQIVAELYRSKPATVNVDLMAKIQTSVVYADPTDPRKWEETLITPNLKRPADDVYVRLTLGDDTNLWVYGVRVWYRAGK